MKVAIVGAAGQLGQDVVEAFGRAGHECSPLGHERIELADLGSVENALEHVCPEVVVNTAAMHHVDRCEETPGRAYAINALGARNLAIHCQKRDIQLIHVSTDYVFDGAKQSPYVEGDLPAPLNVYGNTKLAGEHFIQATAERHAILRTSGLYGVHPCRDKGTNFVDRMLQLAEERDSLRVVDSEVLTPTSTSELATQIVAVAEADATGLFHATAEGSCSWYEFAREIFRVAEVEVDLQVAGPDEFPAKVPRPSYSVLENRRLEEAGLNCLGPWQRALSAYLDRRLVAA